MKKSFFLVLCLILSISLTQAQRKQVDSLKIIISKSGEDSNRVKAFFQLGVQYQYFKPDSGIYYAQQAYTLASAIKYPSYQRRGLSLLANLYVGVGNFTKGMQIYYDALQLAQNQHDDYSIIQVYNNMGSTYNYMEDFPKGLQQLRLAQQYLTAYMAKNKSVEPKFHNIQLYILNNFGECFLGTGQLDSAEYYLKQGLQYQEKHQNYTLNNAFIGDMGILEGKKGNTSAALQYFHEAENAQLKENDLTNLEPVYFSIAELYKKINKPDSAIYYAKKAFSGAREGNFLPEAARASKLLYQLYDQQQNIPLAYMYYKTATQINDSLITKEKIRAMASLDFEAKQRQLEIDAAKIAYKNTVQRYILLGGMGFLALLVFIFWRNALQRKKANTILAKQKTEIETTLSQLRATQTQLIQSEKMASLGELTAGIAHEIQNPLNFVNNFSEVNLELIEEIKSQKSTLKTEEIDQLLNDIAANEEKINHHGKRADAIVKGMLQHSRSSNGVKEPTDINALCDEYLRLAYHGLRAKDKSFNAELKTVFDESIGTINIVPQDIGRVILNLITNAFYAVDEKQKVERLQNSNTNYQPTVTVSTQKLNGKIEIRVMDNGNGIPEAIKEKIFQPFFTTKPTGQGTGLGLSLSYDIVKTHGGEIKVETKAGEYTTFAITLPV